MRKRTLHTAVSFDAGSLPGSQHEAESAIERDAAMMCTRWAQRHSSPV